MSTPVNVPVSLSRHTLRQLKFVIPGGVTTYYLRTHQVFWGLVNGMGWEGWGRYVIYIWHYYSKISWLQLNDNSTLIAKLLSFAFCRTAAVTSLGLGLVIVALFLYVLLVPWIRGIEPNVRGAISSPSTAERLTDYLRHASTVSIMERVRRTFFSNSSPHSFHRDGVVVTLSDSWSVVKLGISGGDCWWWVSKRRGSEHVTKSLTTSYPA